MKETWRASFKVFFSGLPVLFARWLDYGVSQVGVPRNGSMHISGAAPTEVKEDDEDNDADKQDEVETFTNVVAIKNSSFNEVGLGGWYGNRIG